MVISGAARLISSIRAAISPVTMGAEKEVPLQIDVARQTLAAARTEEARAELTVTLTTAEVANLVNAMAAFTPPPTGTTTLDSSYAALMPTLAANWTN